MKIGVIIPDRGDRPRFMKHCNWLLSQQTIQPDEVYRVNETPRSDVCDITYRYRKGYEYFRNKGFDIIFLIENDDWYSPNYIEKQLATWKNAGKPDLFGMRETEYYHIKHFAHFTFHHEQRSSAMNTLIKPDLIFPWCDDDYEYTDVWLYSQLNYKLWLPESPICIGIKHGTGMTGGKCHDDDLDMYRNRDTDKSWLKNHTDSASFQFYSTFFEAHIGSHNEPR